MKKNYQIKPLSYAVGLAIVASTVSNNAISQAQLEEVVVTATKRAESAQDIPITVQAIGEQSLKDLNITNFEDYIKNLPGVTAGGRGPGRQNVYIRGVSAGKGGIKSVGSSGSEPNVAFYLDEAPISIGGRSLDPYVTDINRVEVLPGPQGTLFGASSQAGTIRLISNKPIFNEESAGFSTSLSSTKGGEMSNSVEGFINLPLIEDKLAARLAVYNVKEGGYIDNVPASKQISLDNPALTNAPVSRATVTNTNFAGDDFNDATYQGFRGGLKFAVNEHVDVLVQHTHQELETEGVWDFDPELGDLKVQTFAPDTSEDVWDLTALTITGRLGMLDVIYTGSYLDRELEATQDYSGYADVGPFIPYYICSYPGYATCGAPNLSVNQFYALERTTHEFRVNSDSDQRLRWIVGVFSDETTTTERGDFYYPAAIEQGFAPNAPIPGSGVSNPNARSLGVTFFNDFIRGKEELAFFGELAFDISDSWTATVGARYYDLDLSLVGSSNFANRDADGDSGNNAVTRLAGQSPANFTGTITKFNLQWQINEDMQIYATRSEGYRPGGFNRNGGDVSSDDPNVSIPFAFESDELTNNELGWKTEWLDNALRVNGSIYYLELFGLQVPTLDFRISNTAFIDNTADAEVRGMELDAVWLATDTLSVFANVSYNDTEVVGIPDGIVSVSPAGSSLALAPELQYVLRVRNDWTLGSYDVFAQASMQYTDDTSSSLVVADRFPQDSYTTFDMSLGTSHNSWTATLFVENVTDERAQLFISNEDDIIKTSTNRPRTIGVRFSYDFGG